MAKNGNFAKRPGIDMNYDANSLPDAGVQEQAGCQWIMTTDESRHHKNFSFFGVELVDLLTPVVLVSPDSVTTTTMLSNKGWPVLGRTNEKVAAASHYLTGP